MIARLEGVVVEAAGGVVVLAVGGVGYKIAIPRTCDVNVGDETMLHTYLAVRETALDLYGFTSREDLTMFELLLTLPQVGPKSALQILDQADVALITKAVTNDDAPYLSKMSGIGKKSAEKIVMGLKDKLDGFAISEKISAPHSGDSDLVDALVALGYSERDARSALQNVSSDISDTNARIKEALKVLSS